MVASKDAIPVETFQELDKINANWVVVNPYAFSVDEKATQVIYNSERQWWGERPEGIKDAIQKAHAAGYKVMLKPHVWIRGGWVGNVDFENKEQLKEWQDSYSEYILLMANIAAEENVELFCIGTEYDLTVLSDANYWKNLIKTIKVNYKGSLTYASNWTHFDQLDIWSELDYIGIDAYFPLVDSKTPTVSELKEAWNGPKEKIKSIAEKYAKPILFTEFGYLSVDGCAHEHWKLESIRHELPTNEQAQANAYEALLETFLPEDWYKGCFLWKWYPNERANMGEGHLKKDYTPQGKLAEKVLFEVYGKH